MHSSKRSQYLEKAFTDSNQAEVFHKTQVQTGSSKFIVFLCAPQSRKVEYEHCEIMRPEPRKQRASVAVPELR